MCKWNWFLHIKIHCATISFNQTCVKWNLQYNLLATFLFWILFQEIRLILESFWTFSFCCFLAFSSQNCFVGRDPVSASYSGGRGKAVWGNFSLPLSCRYNSGNLQTFGDYNAGWEVMKCSNFIMIFCKQAFKVIWNEEIYS